MRSASAEEGLKNWIALLKQWRIGGVVACTGFVASCVILVSITPVYKADVQLLLPINSIEDPASRKTTSFQADPFVVRSYADMIINEATSARVIEKLHLADKPEFIDHPNFFKNSIAYLLKLVTSNSDDNTSALFSKKELSAAALLGNYQGRLKATNDGRSLIVDLSFKAHDPRLAEAIVNAHAQAFVDGEIERYRAAAATKSEWMKRELDRTEADFLKSQESLQLGSPGSSILQDRTGAGISALRMRESLAKTTVDVYGSVLKRYQDMLADEGYKSSDIKIVSLATLPTHPYFPQKMLSAAVAALVWLILGIVAAAVAAVLRDRVSIEEWIKNNNRPILGRLNFPHWRYVVWSSRSGRVGRRLFWEQVREVQSAIRASSRRRPVILITSAQPYEGKSLLASAVAFSLSTSGVRTLLVDINARNPRYAKAFGNDASRCCGLGEVLNQTQHVGQTALQVDPNIPLFYLGSSLGDAAMPRVSSQKLRAAFSAMKKRFDVTIIDAPAMESLSDALQLAAISDDVIITALKDNDPRHLEACIQKLEGRMAKIRGVVITDKHRASSTAYAKVAGYEHDLMPAHVWPKSKNHGKLRLFLQNLLKTHSTKERQNALTKMG